MRTTINMDDGVLTEATEYTDIRERMALIHEDLRALVRREATQRLAKLRGKPAATPGYFVAKAKSGETGGFTVRKLMVNHVIGVGASTLIRGHAGCVAGERCHPRAYWTAASSMTFSLK